MRAWMFALLAVGCDVTVNKGDDDDDNDDDNDTTEEGCPERRPWSCDAGGGEMACFQWLVEIDGEPYCLNDECKRNSDCGIGETCCNLESLLGVPYLECVDEGAYYYTASGLYFFTCQD